MLYSESAPVNARKQWLASMVQIQGSLELDAGAVKVLKESGRSLLPVLTGKTDQHKDHVYGIMTTRGIINGNSIYPIRTVRDSRYRLIWNLNHEDKFTNACTKSEAFKSMVQAAEAGDAKAKELVRKYHYRPEYEDKVIS